MPCALSNPDVRHVIGDPERQFQEWTVNDTSVLAPERCSWLFVATALYNGIKSNLYNNIIHHVVMSSCSSYLFSRCAIHN